MTDHDVKSVKLANVDGDTPNVRINLADISKNFGPSRISFVRQQQKQRPRENPSAGLLLLKDLSKITIVT